MKLFFAIWIIIALAPFVAHFMQRDDMPEFLTSDGEMIRWRWMPCILLVIYGIFVAAMSWPLLFS